MPGPSVPLLLPMASKTMLGSKKVHHGLAMPVKLVKQTIRLNMACYGLQVLDFTTNLCVLNGHAVNQHVDQANQLALMKWLPHGLLRHTLRHFVACFLQDAACKAASNNNAFAQTAWQATCAH